MNELGVLLAVAAVVVAYFVMTGPREHLTPTDRIKWNSRPDIPELQRIASMAPASMIASNITEAATRMRWPPDAMLGMNLNNTFMGRFFHEVYTPATAPITEANIDTFLTKYKSDRADSKNPDDAYLVSQINNGNAKAFLKAYFIDQAAAPVAPPRATAPPPAAVSVAAPRAAPAPTILAAPSPSLALPQPTDFSSMLQRYRDALLEAKTTGNVGKQAEADARKAWLDSKLRETQRRLNESRASIQTFIDEYAGSSSEIDKVRRKFKEVRDRGPVLQDVYETDKRSAEAPPLNYDPTPIYSKSLLVVGLSALAFVVWRRL